MKKEAFNLFGHEPVASSYSSREAGRKVMAGMVGPALVSVWSDFDQATHTMGKLCELHLGEDGLLSIRYDPDGIANSVVHMVSSALASGGGAFGLLRGTPYQYQVTPLDATIASRRRTAMTKSRAYEYAQERVNKEGGVWLVTRAVDGTDSSDDFGCSPEWMASELDPGWEVIGRVAPVWPTGQPGYEASRRTAGPGSDPRVDAIRNDPRVGRGTMSIFSEAMDDSDIISDLDKENITDPADAVKWAHFIQDIHDDRDEDMRGMRRDWGRDASRRTAAAYDRHQIAQWVYGGGFNGDFPGVEAGSVFDACLAVMGIENEDPEFSVEWIEAALNKMSDSTLAQVMGGSTGLSNAPGMIGPAGRWDMTDDGGMKHGQRTAAGLFGDLPAVILRYPTGKFGIAGSIPYDLTEPYTSGFTQGRKSMVWDSEQEVIDALLGAGVENFQLSDSSWYRPKTAGRPRKADNDQGCKRCNGTGRCQSCKGKCGPKYDFDRLQFGGPLENESCDECCSGSDYDRGLCPDCNGSGSNRAPTSNYNPTKMSGRRTAWKPKDMKGKTINIGDTVTQGMGTVGTVFETFESDDGEVSVRWEKGFMGKSGPSVEWGSEIVVVPPGTNPEDISFWPEAKRRQAGSDAGSDAGFDAWMAKVDDACYSKVGCSIYDVGDAPFRDWYDDGMKPERAAAKAAKMASEGRRRTADASYPTGLSRMFSGMDETGDATVTGGIDQDDVETGAEQEFDEHGDTVTPGQAAGVAIDHLQEDPEYYDGEKASRRTAGGGPADRKLPFQLDDFERKHLDAWLESNEHPEHIDSTRDAIIRYLTDKDPLALDQGIGWSEIRDWSKQGSAGGPEMVGGGYEDDNGLIGSRRTAFDVPPGDNIDVWDVLPGGAKSMNARLLYGEDGKWYDRTGGNVWLDQSVLDAAAEELNNNDMQGAARVGDYLFKVAGRRTAGDLPPEAMSAVQNATRHAIALQSDVAVVRYESGGDTLYTYAKDIEIRGLGTHGGVFGQDQIVAWVSPDGNIKTAGRLPQGVEKNAEYDFDVFSAWNVDGGKLETVGGGHLARLVAGK